MRETFSVPDVHCEHCDRAIKGALTSLEGVSEATVDLEAKEVTVDYDDGAVDRQKLIEAIEEEGYPVGRSASGGLSVGFAPSDQS
jgi:copper chaperone